MSDLVSNHKIVQIVGIERHEAKHYGRAIEDEQTFYILHSQLCLDNAVDLRLCAYSRALDNGIPLERWAGYKDIPVALFIEHGRLVPSPTNDNDWSAIHG